MKKGQLSELVAAAGIIGAGGAGFPASVKLRSQADTIIANGAECEPLLYSDYHCMMEQMDEIIEGLRLVMEALGAECGIIAIKKKRIELIESARQRIAQMKGINVAELDDFYPAGDEHVLVHELLGRVVPHGGIPPDVGVVVHNVGTLAHIARAAAREPVTWRYTTIAGAVKTPTTFRVPIGTPIGILVDACGGPSIEEPILLHGGTMMGAVVAGSQPVMKNTTGVVILPASNLAAREPLDTLTHTTRIAMSVCDQCFTCTELCPRWHLGHAIEPHRIMRRVGYGLPTGEPGLSNPAYCCECGICSLYACPMGIYPRRLIQYLKPSSPRPAPGSIPLKDVSPLIAEKRLPLKRLMERLHIDQYDRLTVLADAPPVASVKIQLRQGTGSPAQPVVREGRRVKRGERIAEAGGPIGADHHASIDGVVSRIDEAIEIQAQRG